jgi:hypothetical protein
MRYLIGILLILVSLSLVVEGHDTSQATSETTNTQSRFTQNIPSKEQVEATCDQEAIAASCAYKAAIERCGKTILDVNPVTNDVEHNDAVVTRYNKCVEPYRQGARDSNGDFEPSGR